MIQDLDNLLDQLDASREQILIALGDLPDNALTTRGAVGDWAISDLLAILTAWEAELITGLMRIDQNKRPDNLLQALKNPTAYETDCFQKNQERHIDQIFDDWQRVRVQLEGWMETFSWRNLTKAGQYKWFDNKALVEIILEITVGKEQQYLPAVAKFADQWQETAASPTTMIPLISITTEQPNDPDDDPSPD